ncbi:hypothetical protein B0H63DRAFT_394675 [Podospora didyma]|uniref:Uncharacterized protein n=1 Tax=Podospora didyma TaxID=330526 RepID=A0AAE0TZF1_9PEZI|nr:hypothetical protein B0H63DRAFT_394675 [Podospora didyma]
MKELEIKQVEEFLADEAGWQKRLRKLAASGITEGDVELWINILSAKDTRTMVERFTASEALKPVFILQMIIRKDKDMRDTGSFVNLVAHIKKYYMRHRLQEGRSQSHFNLTVDHFRVLVRRLISQCLQWWPAGLVSVAQLAVSYIETISPDDEPEARSILFNDALDCLSWPAFARPFESMRYNWEAQAVLLSLSSRANPPIIISHQGFQAIRKVLVALRKSIPEVQVAVRRAKTWPPYRQVWDGMDERRNPEDDLSRSAQAGVLMRESGYSSDNLDAALTTLGGGFPGAGSPSIQTRAALKPHDYAIYVPWAARVRATRNAREAWMEFQKPPLPDLAPNSTVYYEMFSKLFARPVHDSTQILPGDCMEVFPEYNINLSQYEVARLAPPAPSELYDKMMAQGIKPDGRCLSLLLRNTKSVREACSFLEHSHYKFARRFLEDVLDYNTPINSQDDPTRNTILRRLPMSVFNGWISMLCNTHSPPIWRNRTVRHKHCQIQRAIRLTSLYQEAHPKICRLDKSSWYIILHFLAGTRVMYSKKGEHRNYLLTFKVFLDIMEKVVAAKGLDPVILGLLCSVVRKSLRFATFSNTNEGVPVRRKPNLTESDEFVGHLSSAYRYIVNYLNEALTTYPLENGSLALQHKLTAHDIHRYMITLGALGKAKGMVWLMDWILGAWDEPHMLEDAKLPHELGHGWICRTFVYFSQLGRQMVDPDEMQRLHDRWTLLVSEKSCTWDWPASVYSHELAAVDQTIALQWSHYVNEIALDEPGAGKKLRVQTT